VLTAFVVALHAEAVALGAEGLGGDELGGDALGADAAGGGASVDTGSGALSSQPARAPASKATPIPQFRERRPMAAGCNETPRRGQAALTIWAAGVTIGRLARPRYMPDKISRRLFLASPALVACSSASGRRSSPASECKAHSSPRPAEPMPTEPMPTEQGRPIASIVRDERYLRAVATALELAGGLAFVKRGDTVVLKVNTNSGDPYPYSSNPELVAFLGAALRRRGARVVVGDRSFWGDDDTRGNLERNGIAAAAREVGAELLVFDESIAWTAVRAELVPSWVGPVRVPRVAAEAEHIINLPCAKTHFITQTTLSLKNALGWVHPEDRARPGNLRNHRQDRIYRQTIDINRALRPTLNILDGHRALVAGGPTPHSGADARIVDAHTIIASPDCVATDALGIALIKQWANHDEEVTRSPTWANPMMRAATAANIGIVGPEQLQMASRGVAASLLEAARSA
jgi:uncharacterized protein (DUF362 family)